ncbi:hypothetical protein Pelo_13367 [Pelomyxa schiedti]|nr:hypothetical protein Pelo_13367 [Pelomyxa schiedti]
MDSRTSVHVIKTACHIVVAEFAAQLCCALIITFTVSFWTSEPHEQGQLKKSLRDDDIQLLPTCAVQEGPQTPPSVTTTTTSVLKPPKKAYLGISYFSSELLVTLQAALHLTDTDLQLAGKSSANAQRKAISDWAAKTGNMETTKTAVASIKEKQAVPQQQPLKRRPSASQVAPIPKETATAPQPKRPRKR